MFPENEYVNIAFAISSQVFMFFLTFYSIKFSHLIYYRNANLENESIHCLSPMGKHIELSEKHLNVLLFMQRYMNMFSSQ